MDFAAIFAVGYIVIEAVGIVCAALAIWETRTSQGAIAWAIGLVGNPIIAVPLYLVFGRRRFRGYLTARRAAEISSHQSPGAVATFTPSTETLPARQLGPIRAIERLADMPFTQGNDVRLLIDGEEIFETIFNAIDTAQSYVLVQFFIIKDDELGRALSARLAAAAERGIRIYLLYDEVGSHATKRSYFDDLRRAGVAVSPFQSTKGRGNRFQLNFRNHRKIVVADGQVAYIGGANVGDEYMGRNPKFGRWRDTKVEMRGPIVQAAQLAFEEDWFWATRERLQLEWTLKPAENSNKVALVMATGPADLHENCSLSVVQAINATAKRAWIVSPYFVPDLSVMSALRLAVLRGVDVRIMVPDKVDHMLVWLAAFAYFDELEGLGIQFYRYTEGFLHQKVALFDDGAATIGTVNMDNRSFRLNFEVTTIVLDRDFAARVEEMLEADFAGCRKYDHSEYKRRPFWFKLAVRMARLASPVL